MECHMAFIALTEILRRFLRPKIRLGEEHPVRIARIDRRPDLLDDGVGLTEIFATRAFPLDEIGNGIEPQTIDAHVEPVSHDVEDGFKNAGIVEVQIGLMRIEAMPIKCLGLIVPGPIRFFGVEKDNWGVLIALVRLRPDVEIARRRAGLCFAGAFEPRVLIRGMIDHELGDHP